jgi:hypothetical protein
MSFVNNFFELRSDAAKICLNNRRPIPVRSETIGPWLEVLGFTAWLAALNNTALVYLFQQSADAHLPGHSKYETTMRSHVHPAASHGFVSTMNQTLTGSTDGQSAFSLSRLLPSSLPTSSPAGALVAAFILVLTAEHLYSLVRGGVRHILERLVWRGSHEEMVVRRREWLLRVATLESHVRELDAGPAETTTDIPSSVPDISHPAFWASENDIGPDAIRSTGKTQ